MELPDPYASRAVLIGVHRYTQLPDLPAVERNLTDLRTALIDPEIWGLSPDDCRIVAQPVDSGAILGAVLAAGREAQDTLLVYYAGHGLIDPHNDALGLALPGSNADLPGTALEFRYLRNVIRDPRVRARRKVVILDCCYSGRALEGGMGAVPARFAVTEGTHVLTASGSTERAWSPPDEEHTAFTGELLTLLDQGIPGGPELLTTEAIYHHVYTELLAKGRPLPQQHNRDAGGTIVLARNRASGGATPARLFRTGRTPGRGLRRFTSGARGRAALALTVAATLAVTVAVTLLVDGVRRTGEPAAGVTPAALQACGDSRKLPSGGIAYQCEDRQGRTAVLETFPDRAAMDDAYARSVGNAGVEQSTGDCATEEDAEHRYPGTGAARGRVLCVTRDGQTTVQWSDDDKHTIARIQVQAAGLRTLRDSWSAVTAPEPAFPTADEGWLIDLPVAGGCDRAGVEELDDFPGAVAAVRCDETGGAGAQSVTYFRFTSTQRLQAAMNARIPGDKDPTAPGCEDAKAPRFTGGRPYDVRGVFLGLLLCRPEPDGNVAMEWSVETLLVAGRAVGSDATQLAAWWRIDRGPPLVKTVEAVNRSDDFPSAAEQALLERIPPASRRLCMRPSGEFKTEHVGTYPVVAGVVCGPTSGPAIVFYYQFTNLADLRADFGPASPTAGDCSATPTTVTGDSAYTRDGATGRLACADDNGYLERIWTDERRLIKVLAFQGRDARAMADWWENDAGPR